MPRRIIDRELISTKDRLCLSLENRWDIVLDYMGYRDDEPLEALYDENDVESSERTSKGMSCCSQPHSFTFAD